MVELNNSDLLKYYQLKNLVRYNTRTRLKDESVAEHSYYVSLFALQLADKYNVSNEIKLQVLIKAILHDLPEIDLNDITHDVKEKLNLRPLLKVYEDEFYKKYFNKYLNLMSDKNELVDNIVKLADVYSVKQYCLNEIILGNTDESLKKILDNSINRIKNIEEKLNEILGNRD